MRTILFFLFFTVSIMTMANGVLDLVPRNYREGLKEYESMILGGASIESNEGYNSGLLQYTSQLEHQSKCFNDLLNEFFKVLSKKTSEVHHNPAWLSSSTKNHPEDSGWYWKAALELAGGNKNLAMMLVGHCGHDNLHGFGSCTKGPFDRDSEVYLQGSLGEETLLSDSMVQEIASIQAPQKGASSLPSKYYHVIGAAYTACSLKRNGIPDFLISNIQKASTRGYRSMRLCQSLDDYDSYLPIFQLDLASVDFTAISKRNAECPSSWEWCALSGQDWHYLESQPSSFKSRILGYKEKYEANQLIKNNIVKNQDCKNVMGTHGIDELKKLAENTSFQCDGKLPPDRCGAAKNRLKTFWMDFKWTEEQHRLGAEFASKNCEHEPDFMSKLDKYSCQALEMRKQTVPEAEGVDTLEIESSY